MSGFRNRGGVALPRIHKVVIYITRGQDLLVFDQPGATYPGYQVPAGSLEPGEAPAAGALREAREETGLQHLEVVQFLGEAQRDMRDYGAEQIHHRYFFHIRCLQETPVTWEHTDPDPSVISASMPVLPFRFRWAKMPEEVPELLADFGYHLGTLYQALGLKDMT